MAYSITCDNGCGRSLPIPTNEKAATGWRKLSISRNGKHYDAHVCPDCPEEPTRKRLEEIR